MGTQHARAAASAPPPLAATAPLSLPRSRPPRPARLPQRASPASPPSHSHLEGLSGLLSFSFTEGLSPSFSFTPSVRPPLPLIHTADARPLRPLACAQAGLQAVGLVLAEMQKSCGTNPNVCEPSVQGPQYTVKMLVRSDACGCIIGKGGATIQQIRTQSGANVKIETSEASSYDLVSADPIRVLSDGLLMIVIAIRSLRRSP